MIANRYFQIGHIHSSVLDVYYLHLWKHYNVFTQMKSSLYFRYNLCRTQLWDCWGIFTLFTYILQCLMSITYTYESITMYLRRWKVHFTLDIIYVEHSCDRWWVFTHWSLSFFSARCLLRTLMKALRCICTNYRFTVL